MANQKQLAILKQGVEVWNKWRQDLDNLNTRIDLAAADLGGAELNLADLSHAHFEKADLKGAKLMFANLNGAALIGATLIGATLHGADLNRADLREAYLTRASLPWANLSYAFLTGANLNYANLQGIRLAAATLDAADLTGATLGDAILAGSDLSNVIGMENVFHISPSYISTDTLLRSKGKIPEEFLRGCGLSDWEIEEVKLYKPDLSNDEVNKILYRMYDLRATQALQISPLFVSYSHADGPFVDKIGDGLTQWGIRYWRDIHDLKSGRMERQIDRAIELNPTVLLILSKHSLRSDWVEHEVRKARQIEKKLKRDVLCPVALDDSWKSSHWPKRVMEQIMEYNILDFSAWKDDSKFDGMFRRLIDGLELFYKG